MPDDANNPDPVPTDDDTAWPEASEETPGEAARPTPEKDVAIDRDPAINGSPD
jgi:hypothetical protein